MDAAFLVASPLPGCQVPEACRSVLDQRELRLFERDPVDHVRWEAPSGLVVGAWQYAHEGPLDGTPWAVSDAGFAMSTGNLRWPGESWMDRCSRAQRLLQDLTGEVPLEELIARPRGLFTALLARSDGQAAVGADPLGLRFVYYGSNDDVFVASTNATLAARALAPAGRSPSRDAWGVAWLAFSGYRMDDRTGYEGVRLLPQGATVRLVPGAESAVVLPLNDPWRSGGQLECRSFDELVELVRDEIADTLDATAAMDVEHRVVDLTGGKDSRLVLAVVLSAGLSDAFTFRTIGHEDLPDVRVSQELAQQLGLRYSSDFPMHAQPLTYEEQLHGFLDVTAGMTSIGDLKPIRPSVIDEVQVAGSHGECLRLKDRFDHRPHNGSELVDMVEAKTSFGASGALRSPVVKELRSDFRAALTRCTNDDVDPFDAMQSFHLRHRARKRGGPLDELHPALRFLPLYSIDAIRAAFVMGGESRQDEKLHFDVMRRASNLIVAHPFVGPGWSDRILDQRQRSRRPESAAPPATRAGRGPSTSGPSRSARPGAGALMARLTQETFEQRRGVWEAVLRDDANPAWEVVDQAAALRSLEQFPALKGQARRELLGAITAAMWLGEW